MDFLAFKSRFDKYPVFSNQEINKQFPNFNKMNLYHWQQKKYILKLRNNWYTFKHQKSDEYFLFYVANKIYNPSYISLESALTYYGLIPEASFSITSVSTLKTMIFSNNLANFYYASIKKEYFFAYRLIKHNQQVIKIADKEKAILDFLYLRKNIKTKEDIESLRLNKVLINESLNFQKMFNYLEIFKSKTLDKKIHLLKKIVDA
ncbi:MAG: hypothetical protein L3J74_09695 [Bacteroidales bacterium]|nr:hypothetical protein [Bacteroidales bacterium]